MERQCSNCYWCEGNLCCFADSDEFFETTEEDYVCDKWEPEHEIPD